MWFSLAVYVILTAIKEAAKNKLKRADLRIRLIEIRDAIDALYARQHNLSLKPQLSYVTCLDQRTMRMQEH